MPDPLIQIQNLGVSFKGRSRGLGHGPLFWGVKQVCLILEKGDSFCLIGESGSGKSTLALAGLLPFQEGGLLFKGKKITKSNDRNHKTLMKKTQMVFQDPVQALSPFQTLGQSLEEPLAARGIGPSKRQSLLAPLVRDTGLTVDLLKRLPAQASGGQIPGNRPDYPGGPLCKVSPPVRGIAGHDHCPPYPAHGSASHDGPGYGGNGQGHLKRVRLRISRIRGSAP